MRTMKRKSPYKSHIVMRYLSKQNDTLKSVKMSVEVNAENKKFEHLEGKCIDLDSNDSLKDATYFSKNLKSRFMFILRSTRWIQSRKKEMWQKKVVMG